MRRSLLVVIVLALAACESPVATPDAAVPDALMARHGNDAVASVTGAGHFTIADQHRRTSVTAVRFADGSASGQIEWHRERKVHAEVTCLTVDGNRAYVGATVTHSPQVPASVGGDMVFIVEDNGQGSSGTDNLTLAFVGVPPENNYSQLVCDQDPGIVAALLSTITPIEQGNFQVDGG